MQRRSVYSGAPWEARVAYSRAKRIGNVIAVSGSVAVDERGQLVGPGDVYRQASYILVKIDRALRELGATLADVIRTRMYLVDMNDFEELARAHREAFTSIDPATSCVQVAGLVAPEYLVEIEADAVVEG